MDGTWRQRADEKIKEALRAIQKTEAELEPVETTTTPDGSVTSVYNRNGYKITIVRCKDGSITRSTPDGSVTIDKTRSHMFTAHYHNPLDLRYRGITGYLEAMEASKADQPSE